MQTIRTSMTMSLPILLILAMGLAGCSGSSGAPGLQNSGGSSGGSPPAGGWYGGGGSSIGGAATSQGGMVPATRGGSPGQGSSTQAEGGSVVGGNTGTVNRAGSAFGGTTTANTITNGGTRATGGNSNGGTWTGVVAGGTTTAGGASNSGGSTTAGGQVAGGTTSAVGANSAISGSSSRGGSNTSGGTSNRGGSPASGGSSSRGGSSASGGSTATGACGPSSLNQHPFGCKFAWGIADPGGSLSSYSYLQFVSYWVDSSISSAGTYSTCNACNWLKNQVASSNLTPAYYAYIIGFLAHANGIVDGNQTGAKKLTTDGAALVKNNYNAIVAAYGWYAKETYKVWSSKPLIWLLEGDFIQLADAGQSSPMTMTQVGQLAADITCAIKSNMPNAVVAIDHSSWNSDELTNSYWGAMKNVNYDMVWTTGVANNNGFIEASANSSTYNHATATYAYLHGLTGRTILVDTSAGASAAGDSWSTASPAEINARISEGVIAANITGTAPTGLQGNIGKFTSLNALGSCP